MPDIVGSGVFRSVGPASRAERIYPVRKRKPSENDCISCAPKTSWIAPMRSLVLCSAAHSDRQKDGLGAEVRTAFLRSMCSSASPAIIMSVYTGYYSTLGPGIEKLHRKKRKTIQLELSQISNHQSQRQ